MIAKLAAGEARPRQPLRGAAAERRRDPETGLTPLERRVIAELVDGRHKSLAAAYESAAGCSAASAKASVHRMLQRPSVRTALVDAARATLGAGAPVAAQALVDLVSDGRSEYVRVDSAKAILDRAGIGPSDPRPPGGPGFAINIDLSEPGERKITIEGG